MYSRIMIANRGEIACRVIKTCKKLGIETVAIYSTADRENLHVRLADHAICIGPPESSRSYLHLPSIISAAEISNVEAIHPGYGFLSEKAHFADVCRSLGIDFIGPSSEAMQAMCDKSDARRIALGAGVPVLPGSDGPVETDEEALRVAHEIGYPVMIKACAGGGGRGVRVARNDVSLRAGLAQARAEAEVGFGDPSCYIEKFLEHPRHVEVQILGDNHGNVIHLGERDCSIQRRHQKLCEESPSPVLDARTRRRIGESAVELAKACKYTNAGTVEFLYQDGQFYFLEINARIQVEHPVTEMVTGLDIVEEQLRVACGEELRYRQKDIVSTGHAIECRITAEDPQYNFAPCPGTVSLFIEPQMEKVRVDSHCYSGYRVPPNYDSLLGKLVVHGKDRAEAISRMQKALEQFVIDGLKTCLPFHKRLFSHHKFIAADFDLNFLRDEMGL